MNDDFDILFGFYEGARPEVAGRSAPMVPTQVRDRIAKFAAGDVTEEERAEMKKLLQDQPDLIPILVMEIRALREAHA